VGRQHAGARLLVALWDSPEQYQTFMLGAHAPMIKRNPASSSAPQTDVLELLPLCDSGALERHFQVARQTPITLTIEVALFASGHGFKGEAVRLRPKDIDSKRGMLRVIDGKGGRNREVPVAPQMIERLRGYWCFHRNAHCSGCRARAHGLALPRGLCQEVGLQRRQAAGL
jgi:integrase